MKHLLTKKHLALIPLLAFNMAKAQAPFPDMAFLDINKFNVGHLLHGDMWYDPSTGKSTCEFPKGSGKHAGCMSSLWTTGNDGSGSNFLTAQMYRTRGGLDYWPGPLDASGTCSYSTSVNWARIWKVSQSDIVKFKALTVKTFATIPTDILEWPAKGSIYAKGGSSVSLSVPEDMAPFVDTDGDGIYDPFKGDYPKIKGDQMLWWVFNDNGARHDYTGGTPFKIEYRTSVYGYSRGTAADNMIFYEFNMRNKSSVRYLDFRFGFFSDADLGNPYDDYVAFDSSHRMGILYNAVLPDAGGYGYHPPVVGVSFIQMPGDVYPGSMVPPGTFNYFEGSLTGSRRDPRSIADFNNYMYGKDADGNVPYYGNYAYSMSKGAVMCDSNYTLNDRRFLTTTGNYNFQPGTNTIVAMALIATDTTGNACPSIDFKPIKDLGDTAWKIYYNPLKPLGVAEIAALDKTLRVYPNPAVNMLVVDSYTGKELKASMLQVYDMAGRHIEVPMSQNNKQVRLDVSALATGMYSLVYSDNGVMATQKFEKK